MSSSSIGSTDCQEVIRAELKNVVREFLDGEGTHLDRGQLRLVLMLLLQAETDAQGRSDFDFIAQVLNVSGYQYAKPSIADYCFFKELLTEYTWRWIRLPDCLIQDVKFAQMCLPVMSATALSSALRDHPSFRDDRQFWVYYMESSRERWCGLHFSNDLEEFAPDSIKSDIYLMGRAVTVSTQCLLSVSSSVWENRSFVACILNHDPHYLCYLGDSVQYMFPNLVGKSFHRFRHFNQEDYQCFGASKLASSVAKSLWEDNRFVLEEWFRAGLPYHKHFPRAFRKDQTLFLLLAEHGRFSSSQTTTTRDVQYLKTFIMASPDLKKNKAFMMKAIELDSFVWQFAAKEIFYDPDILLLAFSGLKSNISLFAETLGSSSHHRRRTLLRDYFPTVLSKLRIYDDFVSVVLPGMTLPRAQCPLSFLNQGTETSQCFREKIAGYLGVPVGKELRLLRNAQSNLADVAY